MSKSSITTRAIATPNRVTTHPGEVLNEEFLVPLGISVTALALDDCADARGRDAHRRNRQGRAVGDGGHGLAARAVLRLQPRILDEFAGDVRFDQGATRKRRQDPTRRAAARGLIAGPAPGREMLSHRILGALPLPA